MDKEIVIIGAGPAGLGAAYRLRELGYRNFLLLEQNSYLGGLSASFRDPEGFLWDIGGHVIHSHYKYFDDLFLKLLNGKYLKHKRSSWIWIFNRFIPYPLQNNLHHLPPAVMKECLEFIKRAPRNSPPKNFLEWIKKNFGEGIARHFMIPLNSKMWNYPLVLMDKNWAAERISLPKRQGDSNWGHNNKFLFPLEGGTGGFFNAFHPFVKDHLRFNAKAVEINFEKKQITLPGGGKIQYEILINTSPLNYFASIIKRAPRKVRDAGGGLENNNVCVVGIGVKGEGRGKKSWVYFPGKPYPFYRVTYFSNYSPNLAPGPEYFSLMCEVSYKVKKPEASGLVSRTIQALKMGGFILEKDQIVSKYSRNQPYAYPIPTLDRDKKLSLIFDYLEKQGIYSRGRFGAWKYEIGNMDHCLMQGVEIVDRILFQKEEKVFRNE